MGNQLVVAADASINEPLVPAVIRPVVEGADADGYRPGSHHDFELLYEREALRLTRTIYAILGDREEAEDCVQEAFARAYRDWENYRPDAAARFWVQRIAINLALSRRRHQKQAVLKDRLLLRSHTPDRHAERMDLVTALGELPVKQSTALLLRFNHGYNNREIGVTLGISERAVGLRVEAGLKALSKRLTDL